MCFLETEGVGKKKNRTFTSLRAVKLLGLGKKKNYSFVLLSTFRNFAPMKQKSLIFIIVAVGLLCSCQQKAKLPTYGEIKMQRIDSMIEAAQKEIPQLDSLLQHTQQRYDSLKRITDAHREALKATEKELNELGAMRLELDSMQVKFDTQCARVRFLNMKKEELQKKQNEKQPAQ